MAFRGITVMKEAGGSSPGAVRTQAERDEGKE